MWDIIICWFELAGGFRISFMSLLCVCSFVLLFIFFIVISTFFVIGLINLMNFKYETTFWKFLSHFMFEMILDDFFHVHCCWIGTFWTFTRLHKEGSKMTVDLSFEMSEVVRFFLNIDWYRCLKVDLVELVGCIVKLTMIHHWLVRHKCDSLDSLILLDGVAVRVPIIPVVIFIGFI